MNKWPHYQKIISVPASEYHKSYGRNSYGKISVDNDALKRSSYSSDFTASDYHFLLNWMLTW